jgi:photosystem II stability/assembly factor-like uncharacterized protein
MQRFQANFSLNIKRRRPMRARYPTSTIFGLALIVIVFACDTFLDDSIPGDNLVSFSKTNYFVTQGNSVIINLRSIVEQSWVDAELVISQNPALGVLAYLDSVTLVYSPSNSFPEGEDKFVISVLSDGEIVQKVTISITILENGSEFNCDGEIALYAMGDRVHTKPDSPIAIKFLANDILCEIDPEDLVSSVYTAPGHGTAVLDEDLIIYTPASGYTGKDSIVYVISTQDIDAGTSGENNWISYGFIDITVSEKDCYFTFPDYYILDLTDDIVDPMVTTEDCGEAYKILDISDIPCPSENSLGFYYMDESNNSGFVCPSMGFVFSYIVDPAKEPKNDFAHYRMCANGVCKVVAFYVIREPVKTSSWTVLPEWLGYSDDDTYCLHFTDEQTGFVGATNVLKKTTNGGLSWKNTIPEPEEGTARFISDIHFVNTNVGYAAYITIDLQLSVASGGGVLATNDGGESWVEKPFEEGLTSVHFISASVGFISKRNIGLNPAGIYKTTDSGTTWKLVTETGPGNEVRDFGFFDSGEGYAASRWIDNNNSVLRTSNGGDTWSRSGPIDFLFAMSDNGKNMFTATRDNGSPQFGVTRLSKSSDGTTWTKILEQSGVSPSDFSFSPDGTLGIQVGTAKTNGKLGPSALITHDSGVSWQGEKFNIAVPGQLYFHNTSFNSVSIPSERVGYVLATDGIGLPYLIKYEVK